MDKLSNICITLLCAIGALVYSQALYESVGCYTDTATRALDDLELGYSYTPNECFVACAGYQYFSIQDGSYCFCENNLDDATRYGATTGCVDGKGAAYKNSVYKSLVGAQELLAADNACFDATAKETDTPFSPPRNGQISGIRLVHTSGGVSCNGGALTNFGCIYGDPNWIFIEMIEEAAAKTYYPVNGATDGVSDFFAYECRATGGCGVQWYSLANYPSTANEIELINPSYQVTTSQVFSLQFGEGCCDYSIHDNRGRACAQVYFKYDSFDLSTSPTNNPSTSPTHVPSNNPSVSPTHLNCEESDEIQHINWNALQNSINNEIEVPYHSFNISINTDTLEFTFDIDLQYLGFATDGNYDNDYNLPTTYHIGFDAFPTFGRLINEAGNCENRVVSSYDGISDFNTFFGYSEYPYLANNLGSDNYLSYPPTSEHWTLSIKDNECSPINYNGIFNWNELTHCSDFNGNNLISIVDNGESLTLTGTLYVYVISPYSVNNGIDTGYYRTYPLIQQDFTLLITKQVHALSSTNTQLFTASIIGIHEDAMDKSFKVSVLTQSADYIELINPQILATPFAHIDQISISSTGVSSCLTTSSYTCGQIFSIRINETEINCPPADFSGVYDMSFDVECRDNSDVCQVFINDNSGTLVLLDVESNFVDYTCELKSYEMEFDTTMTFYDDSDFLNQHNTESGNYVIGQDAIYAEIVVNYPDDGSGDNLFIFGIEIQNVFVCTVNDSVDLLLDSNGNFEGESGGCLSAEIDIDGPYNIIINGIEDSFYNAQIIPYLDESNVVRFSFLTFNIGRTKMYIHVQLTLILQNGERRRLGRLLSTDLNGEEGSNQIRHFSGSVNVIHKTTETNILTTEYTNPEIHTSNTSLNKHLFSVLFVFLCFIIF